MAYEERKPHRAEYGVRYHDDSGWERLVSVDYANDRVYVEIDGGEITFNVKHLEWLEDALRTCRYATLPLKRPEPQREVTSEGK